MSAGGTPMRENEQEYLLGLRLAVHDLEALREAAKQAYPGEFAQWEHAPAEELTEVVLNKLTSLENVFDIIGHKVELRGHQQGPFCQDRLHDYVVVHGFGPPSADGLTLGRELYARGDDYATIGFAEIQRLG